MPHIASPAQMNAAMLTSVGSSSRRRKTKGRSQNQHEHSRDRVRAEPPVMWPDSGSGFEADPFSPAGSVQREGLFFQGLVRRRGGRAGLWILIGIVMLI